MSTYTSEPGTRLAGRYRLVDQTSAGPGWTFWKAVDEPLARSVTVLSFAADFPRIAEATAAARAASRLNDPRFSQVFDVEEADEGAYVVMEWVASESLLDMLADGPLDGAQAVSLMAAAARAVAAAHAIGLAHLQLNPRCLHWTRGGGVKITGLGIDAVLAGLPAAGPAVTGPGRADPAGGLAHTDELPEVTGELPEITGELDKVAGELTEVSGELPAVTDELPELADLPGVTSGDPGPGDDSPEVRDTRDLARLLYAALTGYWPGPQPSPGLTGPDEARAGSGPEKAGPAGLPPAPEADGVLRTPRQVSAAVPADIDALTCQALFQRPSRPGPALSTPAMLAAALADVTPPTPLPVPAAATTSFQTPGAQTGDGTRAVSGSSRATAAHSRPGGAPGPGRSRRRPATVVLGVVVVLVLVAAGVAGWAISHRSNGTSASPGGQASSSAPAAASSVLLTPVSASSFDVLGNDGGDEDGSQAKNAIDSNPGTFWHTDYYLTYPALGNLKKGTGLLLDMGKQVRLSQVVVQFGDSCCTTAQIQIGNDKSLVASALNSFTSVASSSTAHGVTTFNVSSSATGRYVLIWMTRLAPLAGTSNQYQAQIYNILVRGSAVSRSG